MLGVFAKGVASAALITLMSLAQAEQFQVDDIEVRGLQRVSLGSVLSQLSVREGDLVDDRNASVWLHEVYKTGYFYSVEVEREGASLVIQVVERPAIETVEFDGNKSIPTSSLENVFADVGLAKGEIFSRSLLENIQLELEKQYGAQGRYNATVEAEVTPLTRNRVGIKLDINEGPVAKIIDLEIIGNQRFNDQQLTDVFNLREYDGDKFWRAFSKKHQFASAALAGDVQRLEDFYFDRGYLDFAVESEQVSISENKADIRIVLNIQEGRQYRVASVQLLGDLIHLEDELKALVSIETDSVYSRSDVSNVVRDIKNRLNEAGYAFANVRDFQQPLAGEDRVDVIIQVQPGYPVYVNRIQIQGNSATNDEVIRRELRQLERALVVNDKIVSSKARLERLGYFTSVAIETVPVTGREDLVDLVVTVEEAKDSQINLAGGYADGSGFFGEFSISQSNFMGKGVDFSASVNVNSTTQNYQLSLENPFFTLDGVSLGADLFYKKSDYSKATFSTYATNSAGGRVTLGYPLSENQRVNYGLGLSQDELFLNEENATLEMLEFRENYGSDYLISTGRIGWNYNTLNGTIKADDGAYAALNLEVAVPPGDLNYYRLTGNAQKYLNFADDFALRFHTDLGYGQGIGDSNLLPFYKNFYSGGARSVRGFQYGSLGPKGTSQDLTSLASPIGGNIKIEYGMELLFPTPIVKDKRAYRTSLFVDAGNVYSDQCHSQNSACDNGIDFDEIRYSAGIDLTWITPIAPLSFSYAWPLNAQSGDLTNNFAFNIGISY